MTDTFRIGMALIIASIFAGLGFIAWLEWMCHVNGWPSISYRVETWADRNPWFRALALVIVFVLLSHFVNNKLFPPPMN